MTKRVVCCLCNFDLSKLVLILLWKMAGFKSLVFSRIVSHLQRAIEAYQKMIKSISRTSPSKLA